MDCVYKKALDKIKCDTLSQPKSWVLVGPTGPKGPATFKVGNTITGESGTKASVVNNGDNENAILSFTIPKGDIGPTGPKGDIGPTGPKGDIGPTLLRSSYIVTFNDGNEIKVASLANLPLKRVELDLTGLITLENNLIKFNIPGYYRISFTVSAYPDVESIDFDPETDIVSIGFRMHNTDEVYIGSSVWVYNGEAVEIIGQGLISVTNTNNSYELANLSKKNINLDSPLLANVATTSYFSNSFITLVIDYLGRQEN